MRSATTTSATPKIYQNIKVTDPSAAVWVSPVDNYLDICSEEIVNARGKDNYIVLIGPTGSGKSSFIEAIASKSTREPLAIAKDQLESVTQQPCIYEIKNLKDSYRYKIYIIDTPGFADPRVSELQVFDQITHWRDRCQQSDGWVRLLYFHPITDIRMPASRKLCLDMVRRFWGLRLGARAMLVTSFWDCVPARSRNATEERFAQLSANHWGDWIEGGSSAIKFENTFDSAMEILNAVCVSKATKDIYPEVSGLGMVGTTGNPVYEALSSRLSSLEQQRATLREDLAHPATQGHTELIIILTKELEKVELLLQKFTAEMDNFLKRFGPPQDSPQGRQKLSVAEVIDGPRITTDAVAANPMPAPILHVADTSLIETGVVDSATPASNVVMKRSTGPADSANTHKAEAVVPRKASLPKRFGQWVDKKVNKMPLGPFGRKGA